MSTKITFYPSYRSDGSEKSATKRARRHYVFMRQSNLYGPQRVNESSLTRRTRFAQLNLARPHLKAWSYFTRRQIE